MKLNLPLGRKILSLGAAAALHWLTSACATHTAYDSALRQAFNEFDARASRTVASPGSGQTLPQFSRLRGRLEMLVFPKISDQASKTQDTPLLTYGAPIRFGITAQRLLECSKLRKENSTKWAHREFFPADLPSGSDCGILDVRQLDPRPSPGSIRQGDLAAARVYLDSNYRTHGIEIEIHEDSRRTRTARLRWQAGEPSSSGLTLFPIDVPVAGRMDAVDAPLPLPADPYVAAKLKKFGARQCLESRLYRYRDVYGNTTVVGWCEGDAWPSTMENHRFFAIQVGAEVES